MSEKRPLTLVRIVAALVITGAVCAGVVLTLRSQPGDTTVAPSPTHDRVEFVPPPGSYHTAWLVAGPFEEEVPGLEAVSEVSEDEKLGGKPWKLLASRDSQVTLSDEPGGTWYMALTLAPEKPCVRHLKTISAGKLRAWLNGKSLGKSTAEPQFGGHVASFELKLGAGDNLLLMETASGPTAALFLAVLKQLATQPADDGFGLGPSYEDAPEPAVLTLRAAKPARLREVLARSLYLKRSDLNIWLEPGEKSALRLSRGASSPRVDGSFKVTLTASPAGAKPEKGTASAVSAAELLAKGRILEVTAPQGDYLDLTFSAAVADAASGKALAAANCRFFSQKGIRASAAALRASALELGGKTDMNRAALAMLKAEKARLHLSGYTPGETQALRAIEELRAGRDSLAAAAKGEDPLASDVGWLERAYWCPTDESAQPYRVYVPKQLVDPAVREGAKLPMVVYLHGYVPGHDKHRWVEWSEVSGLCRVAEQAGPAIVLVPFGRSNTDFVSIGEVDVLRAIDEACRAYPVDRDRISLFGYSMGGYGAYALATHYPDRFASVVAMSGRSEPYFLERQTMIGFPRDKQPRYKGYCLDVDTPVELAANLFRTPLLVYHAVGDALVPEQSARRMIAAVNKNGGKAEFREIRGDHWSGFDVMGTAEPMEWMLSHKRSPRPMAVRLKTYSPRFGKSYWVQVETVRKWTRPAEMSVSEDGQGAVEVMATNVREFTLDDIKAPKGLKVSGAEGFEIIAIQKEPGRWNVRGRFKKAPSDGRWRKGPTLSGPMKEACNTPFVVVYDQAGERKAPAGADPATAPLELDPRSTEALAWRF
ncbi:MAG: carboxylesterase family protein, partial [Planctomycetota bacterium]